MPKYMIQRRIHTLIQYAIAEKGSLRPFVRAGIRFSPWEPDLNTAWKHRFWLAEGEISSCTFTKAWNAFHKPLTQIVSRIAFIVQAYHLHLGQPFLIRRSDADVAYFYHSRDTEAVSLMLMDDELKALDGLLDKSDVPEEFYLYWNDANNTFGYSSKLLLMLAALESLFRKGSKDNAEYYAKLDAVFGGELKTELYGTKEDRGKSGLRQRLVHGEYLSKDDTKNYVEEIHKHIIRYFNSRVLGNDLINENVVNPQRHFFGNSEVWKGFIRAEAGRPLDLKNVLMAFDDDSNNPEGYEIVPPEKYPASY